MKRTGRYFLCIVFLFSAVFLASAQKPAILAPFQTVTSGTIDTAFIKVASFSNIVGMQFTIRWDSSVLRYKGLEQFSMGLSQEKNFGVQKTSSGILTFSWYDESLRGVSLTDSTVLFAIPFEIVGSPDTESALRFSDDPTLREVVDLSYRAVPADFKDGRISVRGVTTSISYADPENVLTVTESFPNPFDQETKIYFELEKRAPLQLRLFDAQGRLISEENRFFDRGAHWLRLDAGRFPVKGLYYYQITGPGFWATQKLIRL